MKINFKKVLASVAVAAFMAAPAFAGSISFNSSAGVNTPIAVALEAMGNARNFTMTSTSNGVNFINGAALRIVPGQALSTGSVLTVSFANAGFGNTPVYICEIDATNNTSAQSPAATATPSSNSTSQAFVLGRGVSASNQVVITTSANSSTCSDSNGAFIVRFQPISSAAMASASYTVSLSGTTYDSGNAVNNIGNISRQYSTAYAANNTNIDFLNYAANGSKFEGNVTTSAGANANIVNAAKQFDTVGNGGLTVSALIGLQDTASWQGVSKLYIVNGAASTCNVANNSAVVNAPSSGVANISIPTTIFNGNAAIAASNVTVCADVAGTTTLNTRTITGAIDITVSGTGANDPAQDSYTTLMNWYSNGFQGILPYATTYSGYPTYCLINNTGSSSAGITVDILTAESGASLSSLGGLSIGSVAASGTKLIAFSGTAITPYTYSNGSESAGTAVSLTGLNSTVDRYAARINVGGSPTTITTKCYQATPAGSYTDIPIFTSGTNTNYLKY